MVSEYADHPCLGASPEPGRHRRGDPEEDGGDPVHLQVQGGGQVGCRGQTITKGECCAVSDLT